RPVVRGRRRPAAVRLQPSAAAVARCARLRAARRAIVGSGRVHVRPVRIGAPRRGLTAASLWTTINRMVKSQEDGLSLTFGALSDPTRRAILARLARGAATVGELAEPFAISLPALSKPLGVLEGGGPGER